MKPSELKELILKTLKTDKRLWNKDQSELNQTLLLHLAERIDEDIIERLLQEKNLREKFFVKIKKNIIKGAYVFKANDFRFFLEENKIDNSYTAYKNRIGLSDGQRFLKDTKDVVLSFPYKDCVLEGGQSTEEGTDIYFEQSKKTGNYEQKQAKRKEIFFNSVLSHDEIDRLFDPKALVNWKRYTKEGEARVGEIKRDEEGIIKENLIIKGNNLLALHSLKQQFAGLVKLIYIDPPYNTGGGGFKYNDNFNHSTWLTFMKNRLEVARFLLRDDGVIFVSCDDNEHSYLKVLMDEIFGRKNFVVNFVWETKRGAQGIVTQNMVVDNYENLITFAKSREKFKFNGLKRNDNEFSNSDNDPRGKWKRQYLQRFGQGFSEKTITNPKNGMKFTFETPYSQEKLDKWIEKGIIIFPSDVNRYPARKEFLSEYTSNKQLVSSLGLYSTKANTEELYRLFDNKKIFKNPKPEKLINFIIEQTTQPGDLVLDYHLGSGTTCAVAHKMRRQYIGIEQMDYIKNIIVERLKKVINGEQGGISKTVHWQGGGDFLYLELAPWNELAKEKIQDCKSLAELSQFFEEMVERYFLNYNLKIKEFKDKVVQEENFIALSLEEQRKIFTAMLDNNQMYVNKTEMEDERFGMDKESIKWTKGFYGG